MIRHSKITAMHIMIQYRRGLKYATPMLISPPIAISKIAYVLTDRWGGENILVNCNIYVG